MGPNSSRPTSVLIVACGIARSILGYPTGRILKGKETCIRIQCVMSVSSRASNCPEAKKQRRPILILYTQHRIRSAKSTAYLKSYIFSHVLSNEGKRSQLCLEMSRENLPLVISGLLPCRASFRKTLDKMMCLRVFAIT